MSILEDFLKQQESSAGNVLLSQLNTGTTPTGSTTGSTTVGSTTGTTTSGGSLDTSGAYVAPIEDTTKGVTTETTKTANQTTTQQSAPTPTDPTRINKDVPYNWNPYEDRNNEYVHDQVTSNLIDPTNTLDKRDLNQEFTEMEEQDGEKLDGTRQAVTSVKPAATVQSAGDVKAQNYKVDIITKDELASAYDQLNDAEPMQAASMVTHLNGLLDGLESGEVPAWAKPAVTKVEQMLAARGISASSVGRDALFNAIITSAIPIAQQDAAFEQQANQLNFENRARGILTDVAAENAAAQFNATSVNQKNQFMSQLQTQVQLQNKTRKETLRQFNATQKNDLTKFASSLQQQRNQFNAQMANVVEQSNVQWRRQINQLNTAGVNAVNQANVQNAFNLSNQALSLLWQEMRDEASFEFKADEATRDRANQLKAAVIANEAAAGGEVGEWMENVLSGIKLWDKAKDFIFD